MLRLYYWHEVHLMMAAALLLHFLSTLRSGISPLLLLQSKPALKSMLQEGGAGRACQFYRAINFFAQLPPNAPTFSAPCTELVCPQWKSSCWLTHDTEFTVLSLHSEHFLVDELDIVDSG